MYRKSSLFHEKRELRKVYRFISRSVFNGKSADRMNANMRKLMIRLLFGIRICLIELLKR